MKNESELVDCKNLARELDVSEQFLRRLARDKKIPFYRLSKRTLRFDRIEVRNFMRRIAKVEHVTGNA